MGFARGVNIWTGSALPASHARRLTLRHPCEGPKNIPPHATGSQLPPRPPGLSCGCCHSMPGSHHRAGTHTTVPSCCLARLQAPKPARYRSATPTVEPRRRSLPSRDGTPTCNATSQQDTSRAPCGSRLRPLAAAQDPPPIHAGTQCPSTAPAGLSHAPWRHQPSRFTAGNPALAAASSLNDLPLKHLYSYINIRIARLRGHSAPGLCSGYIEQRSNGARSKCRAFSTHQEPLTAVSNAPGHQDARRTPQHGLVPAFTPGPSRAHVALGLAEPLLFKESFLIGPGRKQPRLFTAEEPSFPPRQCLGV